MSAARQYIVEFTAGAEGDLEDIVDFVAEHDSPGHAGALLARILGTAESLSTAPHRGSTPRELRAVGVHEYRQTMFKPYRLIYKVQEQPKPVVTIVVIADGRRDIGSLLQRRLLAAPRSGDDPG